MRNLASIQRILDVAPVAGADNLEVVTINGWKCVVNKESNFKKGDLVVYFEIDSILPKDKKWAEFMEPRKYRVRTIKLRDQISQGLVMSIKEVGLNPKKVKEGQDVTDRLGVTKYDPEAALEDISSKKKPWYRKIFLMRYSWYRKLVLPKKENSSFPTHLLSKTDETRVQNLVGMFNQERDAGTKFWVTEKIDGSSCTLTLHKNSKGKEEFYVCSCPP